MAKAKNTPPVENNEETTKSDILTFAEWDVKIIDGKAEKLKVKRPRVVISEDEADILNTGILSGGNTYATMYFKNEDNA